MEIITIVLCLLMLTVGTIVLVIKGCSFGSVLLIIFGWHLASGPFIYLQLTFITLFLFLFSFLFGKIIKITFETKI